MFEGRAFTGRTSHRLAAFWLLGCTLALGVRADGEDLTGTWLLDDSLSDDPALVVREESSQGGGSGIGRSVVRGINIFGIPVGSLPLPSGSSDESSPEEAFAASAYVLAKVTEIRVLQEAAATEIEYSDGTTVTYRHGVPDEREAATVLADWDDAVFEVEHRLANGNKVTENYRLDAATDELRWMVRLKPKKGAAAEIERVYYRKGR
jgi:hypothetical protein